MSGFGMRFHDMKHVHTFAQAEQEWHAAKPWNSESPSWRPLAERRATHKRIVKINEDAYSLELYSTAVVRYHRNGDIELNTYDTAATSAFAWYVKPMHMNIHSVRGVMYWEYPSKEGAQFVRSANQELYLEYVSNKQYKLITNPGLDWEWYLDRKAAAQVRKQLSTYDKWERITRRILGRESQPWAHRPEDIRSLLAAPEQIDQFPYYFNKLGTVSNFRQAAYELTNARVKVPVPHSRLPRRQK